jgi:hypothetical protein
MPVKIKSEKDFWSGLIFIAVGIAFAWGATTYSFGGACERVANATPWDCLALASARPGPAYFPFGLGILLALIGAMVLFESLVIETEGGEKVGHWPLKQGLLILAGVVLFGFALPKLGLSVALPLLIGISSLASGEFHWKEVLVNCVVLTVALTERPWIC